MLRQVIGLSLCATVSLVLTGDVKAAYFTTNGDVVLNAVPAGPLPNPPLENVTEFSGSTSVSKVYTNQTSGVPFGSGNVRTVSFQLITGAVDGLPYSSLTDPATGNPVYAITAVNGSIGPPGVADFSAGELFIVSAAGADPRNPSTFSGASILASYALGPDTTVFAGPAGAPIGTVSPPKTNTSGISTIDPLRPDGNLLFTENTSGPGFITNSDDAYLDEEGLFILFEQRTFEFASGLDPDNGGGAGTIDGGDLTQLNFWADLAGLSDLGADDGAAAFVDPTAGANAFATGLGAGSDAKTFIASGAPGSGTESGDFYALVESTAYIVGTTPEPGSTALFCIGLAAAGFIGRRRRQTQSAA